MRRSHDRLLALITLVVAGGVLLTLPGCGNGGTALKAAEQRAQRAEAERDALKARVTQLETQAASASATTDEASATPSVEPSPPKPTTKPAAPVRQFAYIRTIVLTHGPSASPRYALTADYAQFLTGDAATKAANAAGEEEPPDGYFILNTNQRLRTLSVGHDVKVSLTNAALAAPEAPVTWTVAKFTSAFSAAGEDDAVRVVPYWLTIKDGVVTRIEEQYLP